MINGKSTVLLVEDDHDARKIISRIITDYGRYNVVEVSSAEEAISLYKGEEYCFDAMVVDLVLPGMSGGDLAKINYENKQLPLIVVTAFADSQLAIKLYDYGVEDYTVKPMDSWHFFGTLKNAVIRKTRQQKLENDSDPNRGNVGQIEIVSTMAELGRVNLWVASMLKDVLSSSERVKFMNFFGEFLLNAHEHGNLDLNEKLKSKLLEDNNFDIEVAMREASSRKKIRIRVAAVRGEVSVMILDEGKGFNFEKYLKMTDKEILERIDMLNGRGIILGRNYFDMVKYENNGARVTLVKNVPIQ